MLPETLTRADAVFNLGRMGLLLAGLADPARSSPAATDDRIHQPARTALFPEAPGSCARLVDAGALAASWSGAGPTLIGIVRAGSAAAVRAGAEAALAAAGVPGRVLALRATGAASSTGTRPRSRCRRVSGRSTPVAACVDVARCSWRERRADVERVEHLVVVGLGRLRVAEDLQAVGERLGRVAGRRSGRPAAR